MLRLRTLLPGRYRIICIKDYQASISSFAIFPLVDGQIDYSAYAEYNSVEYDSDREHSSIHTGKEYLGDHSCEHHKVKSYGEKTFTTLDGQSGYLRYRYDDSDRTKRDQLYSFSSHKYLIDYIPRSYKVESATSVTYYTYERTEMTAFGHSLQIQSNGVVREVTDTMTLTWENGKIRRVSTRVILDTRYAPKTTVNSQLIAVSGSSAGSRILDIDVPDIEGSFSPYIHNWERMISHCLEYAAQPPNADFFGAALEAARGFNAYDINLIEAIAGFGLDDLYPRKLSKTMLKEITEFVQSPSLTQAFIKTAYLASTTYLYSKYVVGNNIADIEQLLGLSGSTRFADAAVIADKLSKAISAEEQADWDFRLAKMAQKIVYKWDYLQDTYGGTTNSSSNGFDTVTRINRAHLQATPGPLRDMSTSAIILDDIGLSLRASRIAQAVRLEFIANWFFPIEEDLDRLEFNQAHLNQLYRVRKLCLSDKVTHRFDFESLKYLFGLSDIDIGSLEITDYLRYTRDDFPPTTFRIGPNGGPSLSRILQGSALIITSLH